MSEVILGLDELIAVVGKWVRDKAALLSGESVEIDPELDLLGSGTLDSMSFIQLATYIEELTGRELDLLEIDPDDFSCVRGLCEFALMGGGE